MMELNEGRGEEPDPPRSLATRRLLISELKTPIPSKAAHGVTDMLCYEKARPDDDLESGKNGLHSNAAQLWRYLEERKTDAFLDLLSNGRGYLDVNAPRPSAGAPLLSPARCPGRNGCGALETLLIRACCLDAHEEVDALLKCGANPNNRCADGFAAIHHCAHVDAVDCLRTLLNDAHTDPNAQCPEGRNALHICADDASWQIVNTEKRLKCIELILKHPDFLANSVNKWGNTPLINALHRYYEARIRAMLIYGKDKIDLDWRRFSGQSLRAIISEKFPNLISLMPEPRREDESSSNPNVRLLAYLQRKKLENFKSMLREENIDLKYFYGDPYHCTIIEVACRIPGYEDFVEVLLDYGADHNTVNKIDKSPLIHQAAECANYKALGHLLAQRPLNISIRNAYKETVLHVATQSISPTEDEVKAMENTVEQLLDYTICKPDADDCTAVLDVNASDDGGDTALHNAAIFGLDSLVQMLLRRGADLCKRNNDGNPPLTYFSMDMLQSHLDEQISSNGLSCHSEMFELVCRYDSIVATQENNDVLAEMRSINIIKDNDEIRAALLHPLIRTFLRLKWKNVRALFMLNLLIYVLFVLCLTAYSVLISVDFVERQQNIACLSGNDTNVVDNTSGVRTNNTHPHIVPTIEESETADISKCKQKSPESENLHYIILCTLRVLLSSFLVFLVMREGSQTFIEGKKYFRSKENIMEILLIAGTAMIIFSPYLNDVWDRHTCGLVILLAWAELILISGRLPIFSLQLEMFRQVSVTFLMFMLWYSLIIMAFGISFFILFYGDSPFYTNLSSSFLKTVVMMAGEFEASDLKFEYAPITSHIIFLFFVCFIAIVLLNLLNGLAVYDTQEIKEDATLLSLVSMVHVVNFLEKFLRELLEICQKLNLNRISERIMERLRIFNSKISMKQIHIFPHRGEMTFVLDMKNTERFRKFRVDKDSLKKSTNIVMNRNQESELKRIYGAIIDLSGKLTEIEHMLRDHGVNEKRESDYL